MKFLETFKPGETVYLEDSFMWYCLDMLGLERYKAMSLQERITFKQSYYDGSAW